MVEHYATNCGGCMLYVGLNCNNTIYVNEANIDVYMLMDVESKRKVCERDSLSLSLSLSFPSLCSRGKKEEKERKESGAPSWNSNPKSQPALLHTLAACG